MDLQYGQHVEKSPKAGCFTVADLDAALLFGP